MKIFYLCVLFVLTSCVTPPMAHQIENSRTFSTSKNVIWQDLMEWFTAQQISIKTVEKDSGIIYAERTGIPPGWGYSYADCGKMDNVVISPTSVGLNVFVREEGKNKATVTINTSFSAVYINPWNKIPTGTNCYSRGNLELAILNSIGQKPNR